MSFKENKTIFEGKTSETHLLFSVTDDVHVNEQQSPQKQSTSFLDNVLQVIESYMDDDMFGVEKLCTEIGVSERQLQRKLKAVTNKSPIQLISSVRLHRAKQLLLESDCNVAEVAYQTGFSNPSYFSKSFKKEFGQSPTAFLQNKQAV